MAGACRRIVVVQGHPDRNGGHFCHALAEAFVKGARDIGHSVEVIDVAALDLPFIRSSADHRQGTPPDAIRQAQAAIRNCDHILVIHPLWNGGAPAMLRAFMEQTFRPSFMFPDAAPDKPLDFSSAFRERKALTGKSARVITTMQMPAFIHRWLFRPHQEANALWLAGARPVRQSSIGRVESADPSGRERWLKRAFEMGRQVE